jgi:hypothetical protein
MKHKYVSPHNPEMLMFENGGVGYYGCYEQRLVDLMKDGFHTLPIAHAYNSGFDAGYNRARNELWHILQTKND